MITHVYGGEFMTVSSNPGSTPYVNTNQPMTGLVRYHGNNLQVYDGSSWMTVGGGSANVNLSSEAIGILQWARKKMAEEAEILELAKDNPTIKDLYNKVKMYEDQIRMVKTLVKTADYNEIKPSMIP